MWYDPRNTLKQLTGQRPKALYRLLIAGYSIQEIPAFRAAAKEGQRMALDDKIGLRTDDGKLFHRKANVDIHHAVALHAGQVMVVALSTDAELMASIREINPV